MSGAFTHQVLVCCKDGEGRCGSKGGFELFMHFREVARRLSLMDRVLITQAGCTGQHATGPTVIIHPPGSWYHHVTRDDVEAILQAHVVGGRPLDRLINPEARLEAR